ncbi:MAG: alkaline phosphatase [Saprospiraceae bacterium]|nr:alkaline phosphatase [Saprospiraceae bacterium]
MKRRLTVFVSLVSCILLTRCHSSMEIARSPSPAVKTEIRPTNVILMIGDGMGLTQITAGMYSNGNHLELERFKSIGFQKSHASNKLVTDSAASATAFACGKKTYNGAVGVGTDSLPIKTLLESAKEHGWATGLVASSSIVHATPACFIAHNKSRKNYEEIAEAFPGSGIDYFVGGGLKFFQNRTKDDRDLCQELRNEGYVIEDYFHQDLNNIKPDPTKPYGFLTANEDPLPVESGRDYLLPATFTGLQHLTARSSKGFFYMVEGSQIDWGGHANNSSYIISELLEFDQIIGKVLDYTETHPSTLVIVTGDHETGGYSILESSSMNNLNTAFTTIGHTADLIPVFAFGPGAEAFQGIYENTAIYDKIMSLMGW